MNIVVNQFSNIPNSDEWDRMSIVQYTFVKCLDDFDVAKGYKLSTFAKRYFERALIKYYNVQTTKKRNGGVQDSFEELVELRKEGGGELSGFTATCSEFDDVEFMQLLGEVGLSENELLTCEMIIHEGLERKEIAKRLGVSEVSVYNYLKRISKKMNYDTFAIA